MTRKNEKRKNEKENDEEEEEEAFTTYTMILIFYTLIKFRNLLTLLIFFTLS